MGKTQVKGVTFYVWFYSHPDGYYTYPHLQQGWVATTTTSYVVMDIVQYRALVRGLQKDVMTIVPLVKQDMGKANPTDGDIVSDINTKMKESSSAFFIKDYGSYDKVFVEPKMVNGKRVIQFDPTTWVLSVSGGYFETDPALLKTAMLTMTDAEIRVADSLLKANGPDIGEAIRVEQAAQKAAFEAEAAKIEKQYSDERGAKIRKDSIDYVNEMAAKIKDWQTADTIIYTGDMEIDKGGRKRKPFDWATVSSFTYEGVKKYSVYYPYESYDGSHIAYFIVDADKYAVMKDAYSKKDGKDAEAQSLLYTTARYADNTNIKYLISNTLFLTPTETRQRCMAVSADQREGKLSLPDANYCGESHDFSPRVVSVAEMDKFMKLP